MRSTGTLYALLERHRRGARDGRGAITEGGRRRRDYALTPAGRLELEAEARRLHHAPRDRHSPPAQDGGGAVTRERLAGLAVRAYPDDALASELASTALDVGAESPVRFVRELAGLARAGLRERAARTASVGPARLVFDGFCLAAVWMMTLELSGGLSQRVGRG